MERENTRLRVKVNDFTNGPVKVTIQDNGKKRVRWLCDYRLPNGRRIKKRFRRQREADAWWKREMARIADGSWATEAPPKTVGALFDRYRKSARLTCRSFKSIDSNLKVWERLLGRDTLLAELSASVIEDKLVIRTTEVSLSTVNHDIAILKRVFSWIKSRQIHINDPTKDIKRFRVNNVRVVYLEANLFARLIEACLTSKWWFFTYVVIIAAATGLRKSNVLNLEWSHVDLRSKTMRVTRTKAGEPIAVPMINIVYRILAHLDQSKRDSRYVFPCGEGPKAQFPISFIYREWQRVLKKSGIAKEFADAGRPPFRFHDLRHCFASWLKMRGTDADTLARLLGHADTRMVQRYAHLSPDYFHKEVAKLNDIFSNVSANVFAMFRDEDKELTRR